MNGRLLDAHIYQTERNGYKRTIIIRHQHIKSCMIHYYDPHTQSGFSVDVRTGANKSKKRKSALAFR